MPGHPQFSIKGIMAITAVAALAAWAMTAEPTPYSGLVLWFLVAGLPSAALAVVVEGSGFARRFCLGALIPACMPVLLYGLFISRSLVSPEGAQANDYAKRVIVIFWATALIIGLIVGAVSSFVQRGSKASPGSRASDE
ncbi:MAG TPA: hypothetical protein VHC22_30695 [Pirellulales bacterium]|nr:hypothetical protein [Pirellulales bacterium]